MILGEQDIINAICLHTAERRGIAPTDVEVELMYDEEQGFSAEVSAGGRSWFMIEAGMKEDIGLFLWKERNIRVFPHQIELDVEDEMIARIHD